MPQLQKIVCALDLSEHSKVVAEYATMLAKMSARASWPYTPAPHADPVHRLSCPPNTIDSFVGEIVSGAEKAMTTFVAEHFGDVPVKAEVVVGYAAEEILAWPKTRRPTLSSWVPTGARVSTASCSARWPKRWSKIRLCPC